MSARPAPYLRGALGAVLLVAVALRLFEYLQGRPLWHDEAMIADNVGRHSFLGLLGPLQYFQVAPPLFLWIAEAAVRVGGMSEYVLRFWPLVSGLLVPWVTWRVAKQLAHADAALIAAALAAISVLLIRYSAEVKPYGLEAAVSIALALLVVRVRTDPERSARWWQLAAGGALGMALSFSAVFVLTGCLASLLLDPAIRLQRAGRRRLAWTGACLAGAFAVLYLAFFLPHAADPYMLEYWGKTFLVIGEPDFARRVYRLGRSIAQPFPGLPDVLQIRVQCAAVVLGGVLILRRGGPSAAAQILVPFAAFLVGALVTPYPVVDRLQLFLAPFSFIAAGVVVAEVLGLVRMSPRIAGAIGASLMLAWGAPKALRNLGSPVVAGDSRDPARLVSGATDGDPVYVGALAIPLWVFYSTDWSRPDTMRLDRFARWGPGSHATGSRVELIGEPNGTLYVETLGWVRPTPTTGWAGREAARIAAAAHPAAWVFTNVTPEPVLDSLRTQLAAIGMNVREIRREQKTIVLRVSMGPQRRDAPR